MLVCIGGYLLCIKGGLIDTFKQVGVSVNITHHNKRENNVVPLAEKKFSRKMLTWCVQNV